jgi:hypothetical protein
MTYRNLLIPIALLCLLVSCKDEPVENSVKARKFERIEVVLPKLAYSLGETPDFDEWVVKEVFSDGYEKINTDYTVDWNGDILTPGTTVATVTARNTTVEVNVVIGEKLVDTGLPVVYIETEGGAPIVSKEDYVNATMTIEQGGEVLTECTLRIRGRGNATWLSYPKKPYKLKLDEKAELLGMPSDKDWVLLANYCDKTLMRTGIAFKLGELLGFPWTPKAEYVEVILNGEYLGNYQLAEGVKQGSNRVDIPKTGYLIEKDNYYNQEPIYFVSNKGHGFSFKNPDTDVLTEAEVDYIKGYIDQLEGVLYSSSFADPQDGYAKYIDPESFVRWFLFQQIIANMDTNPYLTKADQTSDSKLEMGPVWDFEWSMGIGWYDGARPRPADYLVWYEEFYFKQLLTDPAFVALLKQMWATYNSSVEEAILQYMTELEQKLMVSQKLNFKRWDIMNEKVSVGGVPMGSFEKEVECDRQFFVNHMDWLGTWISQQNSGN